MRNTKKWLGIVLMLCMMVILFTGCGTKKNSGKDQEITESATENVAVDTTEVAGTDKEEITAEETTTEETTTDEITTEEATTEAEQREILYVSDLKYLEGTEIFTKSAIEHIFNGSVNKKGNASGYHYDGILDSAGSIVSGTKTSPDANGVYTGKVQVSGVDKTGNRGYSSFYPEYMTPQDVVDAIRHAYENREHETGNTYIGESGLGFDIEMYLDDNNKIISAFPVKE